MGRLFGTDGVRGIANQQLTPELAFNLGKAGAAVLSKDKENPLVLIGSDTRISADMLENALTAGILAMGADVIKLGVVPTPAVAYLTKQLGAQAGIVISASHNPFEYNGIKFFNGEGFKLDDKLEDQIEDIIISRVDAKEHITGSKIGKVRHLEDLDPVESYIDFLLSTVDIDLTGKKVVLDCGNGAAYKIAPVVYERLGAEVYTIGCEPDGVNINKNIGSTHPEQLQMKVIEVGADIGLAFDGDADRLIVVDEKGRIIDGDKTICICAKMLKDKGLLAENKVTATVMSNLGFHKYVKEVIGAEVEVTAVGDRYVLESMRETGCVIGGEQSGHIIFLNHTTTGDGILSSLQFMGAVLQSEKAPSELSDEIKIYPQVLVNAKVANENKEDFLKDPKIKEEIAKIEALLEGSGRVLIRPSGTEPLVRVMLEGQDTKQLEVLAQALADMITEKYDK